MWWGDNAVKENYIVMAARTLGFGLGGIVTVLPAYTKGVAGLVIRYKRTSQTSPVPVPIVFPLSSRRE